MSPGGPDTERCGSAYRELNANGETLLAECNLVHFEAEPGNSAGTLVVTLSFCPSIIVGPTTRGGSGAGCWQFRRQTMRRSKAASSKLLELPIHHQDNLARIYRSTWYEPL